MTEAANLPPGSQRQRWDEIDAATQRRLKRRYRAERRFQAYGIAAIIAAIGLLAFLLISIVNVGYSAFVRAELDLTIPLPEERVDPAGDSSAESLKQGEYRDLIGEQVETYVELDGFGDVRLLDELVSNRAPTILRNHVLANRELVGESVTMRLPMASVADQFIKNEESRRALPENRRQLNDKQVRWLDTLREAGVVETNFNWRFLTGSDSRSPEHAGILAALVGSLYTMAVCAALAVPIGVAAALYLEEFAPKNRWTDLIEVNINNLAAVPSIVFGLLGLAIFLNAWGLPRSAPLVGGMVLALMTLPLVIISARSSIRAVPPSIRQGALAVGASPVQTVFHHVLPLALPGILSGTIIGLAQALGETAPLLMIGMMAFITEAPGGFTEPSSALPVQVFLWSTNPERGFVEKTAGGIMVLLFFMIAMNATAVFLRRRFERRW